ncbi:hypothetical protein GobsT_14500 [Gemmata obscuriglobus]|uniref:DUF4297 domain-containing protein n=1 Tax=Gemmata obscuriglobus TaxID=114 RepID=A0A2Z3H272_9BACT|nr:hypothetical protein [Gemmata obscuriglobus]AWM40123.1 hypothetical protein C1280_26040 [Gemmata obscuriglobus]QEG26704.1 hypothetical protein GobsT_14500 [Gemmata obscuriglobus]VTS02401.1 Putative uncharacterized protein OS=Vibrio fischeri SR5 GN=VFSR5_0898 PE=4 SV=1 [Gemmata obscuriglobus UQM 2246]
MSGQAGGRGYLVQALISVLDAPANDHDWSSLALEPDVSSDTVDILWEYPGRRKVVQVKSSQNQISVPDTKSWAEDLERSIAADEYEIRPIGPASQGVIDLGAHGRVQVPAPHNLDLGGLIHQAAHQLDHYFQARQLGIRSPPMREIVVNALVARLSAFATTGTPVRREAFDGLLLTWIGKAVDVGLLPSHVPTMQPPAFEPTPEEVEFLTRLIDSRTKMLLFVRVGLEAGFAVLIDMTEITSSRDGDAAIPYIEGVQHLERHGLLVNPTRDGQVCHPSSEGRALAKKLRGKCACCKGSMVNVGKTRLSRRSGSAATAYVWARNGTGMPSFRSAASGPSR